MSAKITRPFRSAAMRRNEQFNTSPEGRMDKAPGPPCKILVKDGKWLHDPGKSVKTDIKFPTAEEAARAKQYHNLTRNRELWIN